MEMRDNMEEIILIPQIDIRLASREDAEDLLAIYSYYVQNTAATFEYDVPTVEEFGDRIVAISEKYPFLVGELDGQTVGYTYANAFKNKEACDWAVETTIYVDNDYRKIGVGRQLYEELEDCLKSQGIVNMNACIAVPEIADEYLTWDGEIFHEHLGFYSIGQLNNCVYKFNRWYHMLWMEKMLGAHMEWQPPVKKFINTIKYRHFIEYSRNNLSSGYL